jgi:hypothetical protein
MSHGVLDHTKFDEAGEEKLPWRMPRSWHEATGPPVSGNKPFASLEG